MTVSIYAQSLQSFQAIISARAPDGSLTPLTSYSVAFAFIAPNTVPTSATTFTAGSWENGPQPNVASILLGPATPPADITLAPGTYSVFVKVGGPSPQSPILYVDELVIS